MADIQITLPDNSVKKVPKGSTAQDIADLIGPGLARAVVVAKVNGDLKDLNAPINDDSELQLFTGESPEGHDTLLHLSLIHI